jgi:hypothetical protein
MSNDALVRPEDLAASLSQKVEAKIRDSFVELVPEEQWQAMVQSALERFTHRNHKVGYASSDPSPFDKMVHEAIKKQFVKKIEEELQKPDYFEGPWATFGPTPGDAVKNILRDLAPELVALLMGSVVQEATNKMRTALQNMASGGGF